MKIIDPCLLAPIENNATLKRMVALELKHNLDSCTVNLYTNLDPLTKNLDNYFVLSNGSPILKYSFIQKAQIINCDGRDIAEYFSKTEYTNFFDKAKFVKQIWKKEKSKQVENMGTCGTLKPLTDIPYFIKLNTALDKYAWHSLIYQYKYKNVTLYYGIYTPIGQEETKNVNYAAMTCEGTNLQDSPEWSQSDFLANAVLERQIR
jgi:phage anti-repressor protein